MKSAFRLTRFVKKRMNDDTYLCCKIVGKVPGKTVTRLKEACNVAVSEVISEN